MSVLIDDPNMWVTATEEKDKPRTSTRMPTKARNKRHNDEEMAKPVFCAHCGRAVTRLLYTHACTYECALTLAAFDAHQYDYIYTSIMAECMDTRGVSMPRIAPPMPFDTMKPEEYWKMAAEELYHDDVNMTEYLQRRLRENHATCPQEVSKRRR